MSIFFFSNEREGEREKECYFCNREVGHSRLIKSRAPALTPQKFMAFFIDQDSDRISNTLMVSDDRDLMHVSKAKQWFLNSKPISSNRAKFKRMKQKCTKIKFRNASVIPLFNTWTSKQQANFTLFFPQMFPKRQTCYPSHLSLIKNPEWS